MSTIIKAGFGLVLCVVAITYLLGSASKDIMKEVNKVDEKYKKTFR